MDRDDLTVLEREDAAVVGNARLTGMTGAVLFVLLAAEGLTVPGASEHMTLHAFVGMMLVPLILLKTASTGYRIVKYYKGNGAYVRRGAPPALLRVLGPFVVILSIAVVATGVFAIDGGRDSHWAQLHKATFILWFVVMTVHVLAHFIETTHLAAADLGRDRRVPGAATRVVVTAVAVVLGIALAVGTRGFVDNWHQQRSEKFGAPSATHVAPDLRKR